MSGLIKEQKRKIRKKILQSRKSLSVKQVSFKSVEISKKVLSIGKVKNFKSYLVYLPIGNEVDPKNIIHFLKQNSKKVYVLAYFKDDWIISQFTNLDDLGGNKFNTLQPKKIVKTNINEIDLAFIPGVAFDNNGVRLGFGYGVYDKLLKDFTGIKVGLAYEIQVLNNLPKENHDLKVDYLVTEKKIYIN